MTVPQNCRLAILGVFVILIPAVVGCSGDERSRREKDDKQSRLPLSPEVLAVQVPVS